MIRASNSALTSASDLPRVAVGPLAVELAKTSSVRHSRDPLRHQPIDHAPRYFVREIGKNGSNWVSKIAGMEEHDLHGSRVFVEEENVVPIVGRAAPNWTLGHLAVIRIDLCAMSHGGQTIGIE